MTRSSEATTVTLNADELAATWAALDAYRLETTHFLRIYSDVDNTHDDCCSMSRTRAARRHKERELLNARLRHIDGALMALTPEEKL